MMNALHKPLTIACLAVSFFISGLAADFVDAQNTAVGTAASRRPTDFLLSPYLRFGRLTAEDGLSNNQTRVVAQDNQGFMWFGTADGLNRYDGAGVKVYRHDPDDSSSLSHNLIRALLADQSGVLWIGTWGGGLNQYDREKDAFIRYRHDPADPHSLSNNIVRTIYEDREGTIWVGTMGGLNKLDRESRRFTRYQHDPDNPNSPSESTVWSVFEDSTGVLWFGTEGGLNRFDPKTGQFFHHRHNPDDPASLSHDTVKSISEESSGILWIGTDAGLCRLNPETTRFTRYQHDPADPKTLGSNLVYTVYADRAGRLWVGTWGGGLNRFDRETATFTRYIHDTADPYSLSGDNVDQIYEGRHGMLWIATDGGISILDGRAKPFHHYRTITGNPNSLSHNNVRALHASRHGVVWVGTNGGGLNKFDRQTEKFTHYQHDPADPNSLINNAVSVVYEDRRGLVWVGTRGYGLSRFDPATERFTNYRHDAANPRSLSNDTIANIYEDRAGTLWIGTWGGGLNAFDRKARQFTRYGHDPENPHTLSNNAVSSVFEDQVRVLWVGTMGGLNRFDRETKTFERYQHVATDPQSLVHDSVASMYEDRTGTLWIGTAGGLDKFDRQNDRFTHYTTANGLPNDAIWGILEDEQGRLWLSTANGLSRFDPRTESFRNYTASDGLQSNTFLNFSAYSKSQSGEMYFGGSNGFNAFYPDQIVDNPTPPPVLMTDFQLAHKPVPIEADSVLQKSILETDKLVLPFSERVLSFEFAVLNYRAPKQTGYKYRMEGFEKEWNTADRMRRLVTYTNLDPGDYVFRAIGSNNDGVWNEEGASIRITIVPPWWATIWFRIAMGVVAVGLLAGGHRWRLSRLEARRRELEIREARFRATFEQVAVGMAHVAPDGRILRTNRKFCEIVGYPQNEVLVRKFQDFAHPDDLNDYLESGNQLLSGIAETFSMQKRCLRKSAEIVWINLTVSLVRDEEKRPKWFVAVIEDITVIRQVQSERNRILELSQDLICIAGIDGYLTYLNPAWETVLGYSNKELMSRPFLDFIHPDDRENSRQEFESLIAGRQTVDFENRYRQKEGSFRHLSWMATPLPDEQRLYAVGRDITKRKAAEEELEHYQLKLKTLAMQLTITEERERHRIASNLHDQVAQSLVLMRMQIASLDKFATEYGLKDTLDDMSVSLRQTIQRTRDLIYDLSPPQLNEIGLSAAIQEWLKKHVTERFGIKAECTVEGPERQLDNQLRAILFRNSRELVINAIKHAQATQVKVSVLLEENQIIIIVRDDGLGFQAGADSTSSDTGSGFGLFSVKERMADMGGSLEILSEPGQGAEVIMSLPLERG